MFHIGSTEMPMFGCSVVVTGQGLGQRNPIAHLDNVDITG